MSTFPTVYAPPVIPEVLPAVPVSLPSIPTPTPTNTATVLALVQQAVNTLSATAVTKQDLVTLKLATAATSSVGGATSLAPIPPVTTLADTASVFAAKLQSVTVVDTLPAIPDPMYPVGAYVVLTTDGKLYRNISGVWTKAIDGADLIAQSVAAQAIIDGSITGTQIANAAIAAAQLAASAVTTPALALGAVTSAILANDAVGFNQLAAGAVDATKFAAGQAPIAVSNGLPTPAGYTGPLTLFNTADGKLYRYVSASSTWTKAVDGADLIANSITAGAISAGAITATAIAAGAVTTSALAAGSVTAGVVAAGAIGTAELAAGAVTANQLAANSVTAGAISAGAVKANAIDVGAVTATAIAAGSVDATKMNVTSLSAIAANLGTVTAGILQDTAGRVVFDLGAEQLSFYDAQATPVQRVLLGDNAGSYGLQVWDASGNLLFDAAKGAYDTTSHTPISQVLSSLNSGQTVLNNSFAGGSGGWNYGAGWTPPAAPGDKAYFQGSSTTTGGTLSNQQIIPTSAGTQFKASCLISSDPSATGSCAVALLWYDGTQTLIGTSQGYSLTGGPHGNTESDITAAAPANTAFVGIGAVTSACTAGTFSVYAFSLTPMLSSQDQLPDGSTYGRTVNSYLNANRPVVNFGDTFHSNKNLGYMPDGGGRYGVHQVDGNGLALIDFSQSGHVNKNLDNLSDGSNYARPLASHLNGGRPMMDFADTFHLNKNLAYMADGGGRFAAAEAGANVTETRVALQASNLDNHTLDNLGDGSAYSRIKSIGQLGGLPIGSGVGRNFVSNGGFELNTCGGVTITPSNSGGVLCDNWTATVPTGGGASPSNAAQRSGYAPRTGAWCLELTMAGATVPANTAQYGPQANYAGQLDFTGVSKVLMQARVFWDASGSGIGSASGFAGVTLQFTDSTGVATGYAQIYRTTAGDSGYISTVAAVPAGTVSAKLYANCYIYNTTASPLAVTGYPIVLVVDDISIHAISDLDTDVMDGTSYGRVSQTDLSSNRIGLRVAGSGQVIGNQLNAPNSLTLNYGAARTATACTASSSGAVSINAFSVNMGGTTVSYNAVSNAITGLVVGDTYQIYCHDAGGTGGTKTWLAYLGTSTGLLTLGDDVVLAGQVTIPSSGTSGGGGTGTCVSVDAWVIRKNGSRHEFARAKDIVCGDWLRVVDPVTGDERWGRVSYSETKESECVRASTDDGATLTCSVTAPLGTLGGKVLAPDSAGVWLAERVKGLFRHRRGKKPVPVGKKPVQHITCEDTFFLAGDAQDALLAHHNLKP